MSTEAGNENRIRIDEPGDGEQSRDAGANASASEKTAYCAKCHRRHRLASWPEGHPRGDAEAATITGAGSAKELGQQTRDAMAKGKRGPRVTATERKLTAEEEERRRKASVKLGRKVAAAPYSIAVLVTANPDWREELSEQEINETAEDFADFCEAWGIKAVGKIASAVILSIGMATTGGKVYGRVKAKEAERDIHFPRQPQPQPKTAAAPGQNLRP